MSQTHKTEIDQAISQYRTTPSWAWPAWLRNPQDEHEFDLAFAVTIATDPRYAAASPVYDAEGYLTGWDGIALKPPTPGGIPGPAAGGAPS